MECCKILICFFLYTWLRNFELATGFHLIRRHLTKERTDRERERKDTSKAVLQQIYFCFQF